MNTIPLPGCTPEPLMSYLKALGVFRLVAEQADPSARGSWKGGVFVLETTLGREGLTKFFLEDYKPTPILAPWGARSGFYPGSSESAAREALDTICNTTTDRFGIFRDAVAAVRSVLARLGVEAKDDLGDGSNYLDLLLALRAELPEGTSSDALGQWLDAVYVLTSERGRPGRKFPPLLGTGGNEGSGSYVSTFAQVVGSLLVCRQCDGGVATALFGEMTSVLGSVAVGHFSPGAIGGPNSSQGFSGGGGVNPWDYLFAIEGALLLRGTAARRLGADSEGRAGYPFCVEAVAVGYGSAADKEAGEATRAEVWLPLWSSAASVDEIRHLFGEGRAQLGRKQARNAVEFALAACTLGVSRGIDAFTRYAFVMRNGLSYFAAPLGRVAVTPRPAARLLEDPQLGDWVEQLRRACREKDKTPARYQTALRDIDRAIFEFATRSELGEPADRRGLLEVLRAVGRAERTLAGGLAFCEKYIKPLHGLSAQWLQQADDGSPEFALAASVAGIGASKEVGPLRVFLEEVEAKGAFFNWSPGSTSAVWSKRPLADNLAAVFRRRQMEAFRTGQAGVPLWSKCPAPLATVIDFLHERTDDDKLHDLIWGLSALDWRAVERGALPPAEESEVPFEFGVPRLLVERASVALATDRDRWVCTRTDDADEANAKPDPDVFHRLASGGDAVSRCVDRAARRLKSGGLIVTGYRNRYRSGAPLAVASEVRPSRLLAAMLFPLSDRDLARIANSVLYPPETQE